MDFQLSESTSPWSCILHHKFPFATSGRGGQWDRAGHVFSFSPRRPPTGLLLPEEYMWCWMSVASPLEIKKYHFWPEYSFSRLFLKLPPHPD